MNSALAGMIRYDRMLGLCLLFILRNSGDALLVVHMYLYVYYCEKRGCRVFGSLFCFVFGCDLVGFFRLIRLFSFKDKFGCDSAVPRNRRF